ncbi:anti-sigma factor family protein [Acetivibrio cellulolyticus]|uniref:anti-sigma factor family protein n=1 Tax=Acetivibrio cellulolyticus TaxID=35830 RepID=UPI0001E2D51E|nr:anti-sigma factor [Acetivibrio cellulolyticus]
MKKCDEILELLSLYIDDELDEVRAHMVQEHIESCSHCKSEFEQLYEVVKMCKNVDEVELPESFKDALHKKLTDEQHEIGNRKQLIILRSRIMKTMSSVAAVLVIVFVVRGFMNISKNSTANMESSVSRNSLSTIIKEKDAKALTNEDAKDEIVEHGDSDVTISMDKNTKADEVGSGTVIGSNDNKNSTFGVASSAKELQPSGEIKSSSAEKSHTADGAVPKETPSDNTVCVEFSQAVDPQSSSYTISTADSDINHTESTICLKLESDNIESDKLKMNEIAGKFGNKMEDDIVFDTESQPELTASKGFSSAANDASNITDYSVSYYMDKSNYEKFVKEVGTSFNGKYKVTNDEEQLNIRLKALDDYITAIEREDSDNSEKLKSLKEEKENILKQLASINSGGKIRITITITGK